MTNEEFMMRCTECVNLRKIKTTRSTEKNWMQSMCYI